MADSKHRLQAADTCIRRGWHPHMILASDRWKGPRTILKLNRDSGDVKLTCNGGVQWVKTLPADVEAVTEQSLMRLLAKAFELGRAA